MPASARKGFTYNLLLLSAAAICLCSTPSREERFNTTTNAAINNIHILLLNVSDKNCQTDIITSAAIDAVDSLNSLLIFPDFVISATTLPNVCKLEKYALKNILFKEIITRPNALAIIGPVCSTISNAITDVSGLFNIPLVSLAPAVPRVNSYLITVLPSVISLMDGVATLVKAFPEWKRVAIISQDDSLYRTSATHLGNMLRINNVSVSTNIISTSINDINVQELVLRSVRIVVLNMGSDFTRAFLMKAAVAIQHPYVWVTLGFYERWWLSHQKSGQLQTFLHSQGVLYINNILTHSNCNKSSQFNSTHSFIKLLKTRSNDSITSLTYDSVISLFLAINSTMYTNKSEVVNDISSAPALIRSAGQKLMYEIQQTRFHGFLGDICFKDNALPAKAFKLHQFKEGPNGTVLLVQVGEIKLDSGVTFIQGEQKESLWVNGIPLDGSPVTQEKYPELILTAVTYTFASCNILIAVLGILFMLAFRNRRLIRLSSPNLNYLVGVGVIIFNSSVFLFVYPPIPVSVINVFCGLRSWLVAIGYSLCLGTINTKMWRVYYIFRYPKLKSSKTPVKDWHLLLFVVLFLLIDVILLSFTTSFTTSRLQAVSVADAEHKEGGINDEGIEIQYTVTLCDATSKLYWIAILFGYKIVIHLTAVILAFKIRKVQVKVLNDSTEVALILYLTGLVLAAVMITTFTFGSYLNVYSGAFAVGICATSAVILGVVFISKAIALRKDPEGETVFPPTNEPPIGLGTCDEIKEIATLQRKVKTLQAQLTFHNDAHNSLEIETDEQNYPNYTS